MAFVLRHALNCIKREFAHLAVQSANHRRRHFHGPSRDRSIRLHIIAVLVFLQHVRLSQKIERLRYLGSRNFRTASFRKCQRFCTRHSRSKFTEHRIFPTIEIAEGVRLDDFSLATFRHRHQFLEGFLFGRVRLGVIKVNHLAEKLEVATGQVHCRSNSLDSGFTQIEAPFAHIF